MPDTRRTIIAPPWLSIRITADEGSAAAVEVHRLLIVDRRIGRSLPGDHFAAVIAELCEIGVVIVDPIPHQIGTKLLLRSPCFQSDRVPVEGWIGVMEFERVGRKSKGIRTGETVQRLVLAKPPIHAFAQAVARAIPYLVNRVCFLGGQAIGRRRCRQCTADIGRRAERALRRIFKHAVNHAVACVAGPDRCCGCGRFLIRRNRRTDKIFHDDLRKELRHLQTIPINGRCAGQYSIKLVRNRASQFKTLPAASRASIPVAIERLHLVIELGDAARPFHLLANAIVEEIVDDAPVQAAARQEKRAGAASGMPGIRGRSDIVTVDRCGDVADRAGAAATAEVANAAVPVSLHAARTTVARVERQPYANLNLLGLTNVVTGARTRQRGVGEIQPTIRWGWSRCRYNLRRQPAEFWIADETPGRIGANG